MDKSLFNKLSIYRHLQTNECFDDYDFPEPILSDSDIDRIIREIFCVDERTGLPKGDLAYYLSPDGNPVVKQWLENNLLKPRASRGDNPSDLTDDIIAEFSRGSNESVSDYQQRLMGYYDSAVEEQNKLVESNQE